MRDYWKGAERFSHPGWYPGRDGMFEIDGHRIGLTHRRYQSKRIHVDPGECSLHYYVKDRFLYLDFGNTGQVIDSCQ
jgi:hypothetical protein